MPYTVWIKVEDQNGSPGDRSEAWWYVDDEFPTRKAAVRHVERNILPSVPAIRIDDKWTDEDDEDEQ